MGSTMIHVLPWITSSVAALLAIFSTSPKRVLDRMRLADPRGHTRSVLLLVVQSRLPAVVHANSGDRRRGVLWLVRNRLRRRVLLVSLA